MTTQVVTNWKKEWFEIKDATYPNTAAHSRSGYSARAIRTRDLSTGQFNRVNGSRCEATLRGVAWHTITSQSENGKYQTQREYL